MLSDDEQRFLFWWEENREREKNVMKQWLVGLPLGLLFGIPIFINFFRVVQKATMIVNAQVMKKDSDPLVMVIAVLLIISFVAIFSKRLKWDRNEQKYKELKARLNGKIRRIKQRILLSDSRIYGVIDCYEKNAWFLFLVAVVLNSACSKKEFKCPYDPCSRKAPDTEIEQLEAYLSSENLTAVKHCSGLYYQIDSAGAGVAPNGCSEVYVTYKGTLTNGNVFDKAISPVSFSLVQLIEGWKNGLPLIKTGGKIRLFVPPSLGYGPYDYQSIPGNSILVFEIELLDVR